MHKESKHEGVRYSFDQCDYFATEAGNLKKHKRYKHEGICYPCDQCDYVANKASNLKSMRVYGTLVISVIMLLLQQAI